MKFLAAGCFTGSKPILVLIRITIRIQEFFHVERESHKSHTEVERLRGGRIAAESQLRRRCNTALAG